MEIIRIRVQMNGEKTALSSLSAIDAKISEINKKQVNVSVNTRDTQNATNQVKNLGSAAGDTAKQSKLLGDTLSMIKFTAIAAAIGGVTVAFKNALGEMKAVDTELTNIQKVSNMTQAEIKRLGDAAYATASQYGVAADEYLSAVYTFQKAGLGDSAEKLGELATKTMLVGDTTADVASKFLIASNAAWDMQGSYTALSTVVDEADFINNNYATSLDKLAAAMPIVASTSANLGMSIEETMAVIGTITAKTQETGTKAATAWRALAMNITGELGSIVDETGETIEVTEQSVASMADALKIYGNDAVKAAQQTGQLIDPMDAVISLAEAYKDGLLTDIELENILMSVGGKLRTNQLTALVKDLASETSTYYDIMSKLPGAAGTADAEIGIMLSSWESKTKILSNTWTEFVQKSVNTESVKGLLDVVTGLLDGMDNLGLAAENLGGILLMAFSKNMATNIKATVENVKTLVATMKGATTGATALQGAIFGIGAAVTVISAVTMALKQMDEAQLRSAQSAYDSAQAAYESYQAQNDQLYELVAKYREIASDGIGADELEQVQSIQDAINGLIGDQYDAVDLVNGAYQEQIGLLVDIQSGIQAATREEQTLAQVAAARVLQEQADNVFGNGRAMRVANWNTSGATTSEYMRLTSDLSYLHSQNGEIVRIPTNADEIVKWYDEVTEAIRRYTEEYGKDYLELSENDIFQNLQGYEQEFRDVVENYRALSEAIETFGEDSQEAADAQDAYNESLQAAAAAAEDATNAINKVTEAKNALDQALSAPAEDEAFKSISEAVKEFRELIDAGEVNSRAFWNTAEFLFGPEVLEEYYGNAQDLIALFESSDLEGLFDGESLDPFIQRLRTVSDEIAEVQDNADGTSSFVIKDIDALAEELNIPKNQLMALIEYAEAFGALDFSGAGLIDFLEYLGLEFQNGKLSLMELQGELANLGYSDQYIAAITQELEAMGAVDMSGTQSEAEATAQAEEGVKDAAEQAKDAINTVNDTSMQGISGEVSGLTGVIQTADNTARNFRTTLQGIDGTSVTATVTTNYVTRNTVISTGGFSLGSHATGTQNAAGGYALVGDEHSPDGSPRPELISQNGQAFLAGVNGPEIVNLAAGAQVWPYSETKKILGGRALSTSVPAFAMGNLTKMTDSGSGNKTYTANTCRVTFSANGGSGGPGYMTVTKNVAFILPSTRPTRSGYSFSGWAQGSASGRNVYQPGARATVSVATTFYAQWTATASKASGSSVSGSYGTSYSSGYGGGGGSYSGGGGGGGGSSSSKTEDARDTLMDKIQDELTDREFEIWLGQKDGSMSSQQAIEKYRSAMKSVEDYLAQYRAMGEDNNSDYIQKLTKQWWEYSDEITDLMKDIEEAPLKAQKEALEKLSSTASDDLKDQEFSIWLGEKNGTLSYEETIEKYRAAMKSVEGYMAQARKLGEDQNSDYMQELIRQWWEYSDEVESLTQKIAEAPSKAYKESLDAISEAASTEMEDREFSIWKAQREGAMSAEEAIGEYQAAMASLEAYIQQLRDLGEDENSSYIQALTKQWWSYKDEVESLYKEIEEAHTQALRDIVETAQEDMADREYAMWLAEKQGIQTAEDSLEDYRAAMEALADYIQRLRDEGETDNSEYIKTLTKQWWGYSDAVSAILADIAEEAERSRLEAIQSIVDTAGEDMTDREYAIWKAQKEGAMSAAEAVGEYESAMRALEDYIQKLRDLDVDDNDKYIQSLTKQWWGYKDTVSSLMAEIAAEPEKARQEAVNAIADAASAEMKNREFAIWKAQKEGAMSAAESVDEYRAAMSSLEEYIERLRALDEDDNSQYIQTLIRQWWDYSDTVSDILEDLAGEAERQRQATIASITAAVGEDTTDREFDIWKGQKEGALSAAEAVEKYRAAMLSVEDAIRRLKEVGEDETSDSVQALTKQWWGYKDQIESLQNGLIDEMKSSIEAQLAEAAEAKNQKIAAINAQSGAVETLNALEEKRLALLKAQDALLNAQAERTVRIYNAVTGQWEWVADASKVKAAQESVNNAQDALEEEKRSIARETAAAARQAQIDALENDYDALEASYRELLKTLEDQPRTVAEIFQDAQAIGEERTSSVIGSAVDLSEAIATAILKLTGGTGAATVKGKGVLYGASPTTGTSGTVATLKVAGDASGDVNYYINGVEMSAERAEGTTIAELARSLSTLAIYENS